MDASTIIYIIAALIALYLIYYFLIKSTGDVTFTGVEAAKRKNPIVIPGNELKGGNTNDYTMSIWLYVNDWDTGLGNEKIVYQRTRTEESTELYYPRMEVGKYLNTVTFYIAQINDGGAKTNFECSISDVPIQKWTNVILSINNRAVDIYMDGKLVKTCVMDGVSDLATQYDDLTISPVGNQFNGYTSRFRYINNAINPSEATAIYRKGYRPLSLGSVMKYGAKFSLTENEKEISSVSI